MSNFFKKVAVAALLVATVFSGVGPLDVQNAQAQTITELQAQLAALQAQLAALQGSSTTTAYVWTRNLTVGSRGEDVRQLQIFLNTHGAVIAAAGVGSRGAETTYFGALTRAALARWQAANAIAPAVGYFGPITRARVNAIVAAEARVVVPVPVPTPVPTPTPTPVPVPVTGLQFSEASDNPTNMTLPKGATRVTMLKFNVAGNGTVNSVNVRRVGAGATSDFSNVYIYEGDTRLTTGRSLNSTTHSINFTGLNVAVSGVKTLSVVADIASGAGTGNVNGFEVTSAADVVATAAVSGSFPINNGMFTLTNAAVGSITIAKSGSLTNPKVGQMSAKVAEFTLTAGSTEDLWVRNLTLYNVGNVNALNNLVLKQSGTTIATASAMNNRGQIVFNFTSPFSLTKGSVRTFEVYADIAGSARANDTIRLYLENGADLYATGAIYGFGVTVTNTGYDNSANDGTDASWTTIEGGQVTIVFQGPSVTDYAVQQQDVTLAQFNFSSQNNIEVRNTRIALTAGGTDANATSDAGALCNALVANYTDIKLVNATTGQVLTGSKDTTCAAADATDTTQTLVFTDVWNVSAGQTVPVKITADLANFTPTATETIRATLNAFQASDIKNLDNNLFVATTDIVPSGAINGSTHNVRSGTLTTSLAGTPVAQTYINGATNVALTGINLQAGLGKDVKVTSIKVTAVGANSCATETDCVLTIRLYDGATAVSDAKSLSTDNATFSNLNIVIPKGTTKTITVKGDLATLSSVAGSTTIRADVAAATDVTAVDNDGNTVTNSGTVTGPAHTILSAGTLTAALAPLDANTDTRIIVAGKTEETMTLVRFTAANEALTAAKIQVKIPAGNIDEVLSAALYDGATRITDWVTPNSDGTINFNAFTTAFTVPKDSNKTLTVKANLNTTAAGADSSATAFDADLDFDTNFEFRGTGTNTVITSVGSADIDGPDLTLRKTKMTVDQVALSSTTIVSGTEQDVYKFTIAADAAGDVAIKQLKFTVTQTDNVGTNNTLTLGAFKLFRGSSDITANVDIHNTAGATIESTNTLGEGSDTAIVTWSSEEAITAGTTNTYTLRATSTGYTTGADDDSINIVLAADSAVVTSATAVYLIDLDSTTGQVTVGLQDDAQGNIQGTIGATVTTGPNVVWSDNAVVAHSATVTDDADGTADAEVSSGDWINGFQIKNMPLSGTTMVN